MKRNPTRQWAVALLAIFVFVCYLVPGASALTDPNPQAEAAFLADPESGFVLYEKNADQKQYPCWSSKMWTTWMRWWK